MTEHDAQESAGGPKDTETTSDTSEEPRPAEGQETPQKTGREKSLENLKRGRATQFSSGDEAAKNGKKGGRASARKRQERKSLAEALEIALTMPMRSGKVTPIDKVKSFDDVKEANLTVNDRIVVKLVQKAMNGDAKAVELIREQIGEAKPLQVEASVRLVDEAKLHNIKKRIDKDPELLKALMGELDDEEEHRAHRRGAPGPDVDVPSGQMGSGRHRAGDGLLPRRVAADVPPR